MISPKLRNWIAAIVCTVWALNFAASLIPQLKYEADPAIHAVFMAIVGGAFALSRGDKKQEEVERNRRHDDEDREGKPS